MPKHAILLADKEWCEAAASGSIKVYDFRKPRKRGIHALGPGSICVIITKAKAGQPSIVYGEFTVTEVKEVDADEYNRLAREGLIYNPQLLRPNERKWIILFDEFREYNRKIPKKELIDVKTYTSRKPIAEWVITGLSYIDDQALEGIRRKTGGFIRRVAQGPELSLDERIRLLEQRVSYIEGLLSISILQFPLTHECVELMLLDIGKSLGFKVYTADPSKMCNGIRLRDLADMDRNSLSIYAGTRILEHLSRIDVVWHRQGSGFYAFEVVISGSMRDALLRLSDISELNAKLFIVADESRRREFENSIRSSVFNTIRGRCRFLSLAELSRQYILTKLWRQSIEPLQLPYLLGGSHD